jgi:PAS domain S-box-containing protein
VNELLPIAALRHPAAVGDLAALYRLTDRLYRAASRDDVCDAALDAIAETLGCRRSSILLFDADGVMDFVAWRGLSDSYRAAVRGHSPWTRETRDPAPIFVPNIDATDEPDAIKCAIRDENIRALAFIPLMVQGALAGKFMTYDEAPRTFSERERDLAVMIARQFGFALEREAAEDARRSAVSSLRESEERCRLMSENAPVMIWMSDENGGCLHLNRMQREFWGVEDSAIADFDWRTSMHPDDAERIGREIWGAMVARTSVEIVGRYKNTSDEYRVLQTNARPRFSPAGDFLGMIGVNVDVTERERAEHAVREINRTLEERVAARTAERDRLWSNSQDIQLVLDRDGVIQAVSPAVTRILGWRPEQLVGRSFLEFIADRDREGSREAFSRARYGVLPSLPNRCLHVDGSHRWIAWVAAPEGDLIYGSGRDITEERAKEKALAKAEEALRQAQKMEAIGQLTGGIAHDFNNLLQGLVASLELIRRRAGDPESVLRFVEAGLKAVERGSRLTGQLLAFSRAQKLELKPVDVGGLIAGMRELLARTLGPSVRVALDLQDGPLHALGDEVHLEMAVLNLAINSRDAMPNGGSLSIGAHRRSLREDPELPDGSYLEIAVADSGQGMPPDVLARAFDPFFTTKGVGKGTGLGLSQVYGMVRQAGGAVRIDSRPGAGTTVRMLLRHTAEVAEVAADSAPETENAPAAATVMVVDDDADVREFIGETLRELGFDAHEVADGEAALAALDRIDPDAMILDFAMPGRNGAEIAREVRSRRPGLPIIFASGFSETAAIGAVENDPRVLRKPFRAEELRAALAAVLEQA